MSTRLGLVRCEHCYRQFNPHSAARHIPWCSKRQTENNKHRLSAEKQQALERYRWRISYRPSNQFRPVPPQAGQQNLRDLSNRAKKSSINSSATLSSPSAGSTSSIGTSVASGNAETQHHRPRTNGRQTNRPGQPAPACATERRAHLNGELKRSASSLTMARQQGANSRCAVSTGSGSGLPTNRQSARAKSVSDLSNMSEIVELLTKRMEQIYIQNKLLLANISRGNHLRPTTDAASQHQHLDEADCCDSDNPVRCHHCKSSCASDANYCHQCGCKLRLISSAASLEMV